MEFFNIDLKNNFISTQSTLVKTLEANDKAIKEANKKPVGMRWFFLGRHINPSFNNKY